MPPKKNKKPSRNGYWEFVLECRDKQSNKHMNQEELQNYASRKWANMSKEERQPYGGRAMMARDTYRPVKLTTDGFEIEELERQKKEASVREQEMKNDITRTLKAAAVTRDLDEQIFLIIHINHLIYYPAEDKYFICEIAVAAMSLKDGVIDVYHSIVKPGRLPLGFYGGALAHSKETHQLIELVQDEPYEDNTAEVFKAMIDFMRKYTSRDNVLTVYADEKTFEMTTKVIDQLCSDFQYPQEIRVYNLQYLFFALRNAVAGRNVWPTETFSYSEMEKDIYSYTPDIACEFHDMSDISVYCSKSIVTRYVYTICDHCCADLKIQLVAGFHVPAKSKIVTESRTTSKTPSVCSNTMNQSAVDTFGSSYEDNFPSLGCNRSSASSVVSFSSMKSGPSSTKAATRLEHSFKALTLKEAKRNHETLKFPQRGSKQLEN